MKINRTGAIGALLDIYEQVIEDLKKVVDDIPDALLTHITDPLTTDENCQSIRAILSHIISAAYGYATSIHSLKGHNIQRPDKAFHLTARAYSEDLDKVFTFTESVFQDFKDHDLEQYDNSKKIKTVWGQLYDIEQLTEHAIVHILRHKRQIEKIKRNQLH